jgi:hypothetical protein
MKRTPSEAIPVDTTVMRPLALPVPASMLVAIIASRAARRLFTAGMLVAVLSGCASAPDREISTVSPPSAVLVDGRDPMTGQYKTRFGEVFSSKGDIFRFYEAQRGHALNVLALSGGGQNGAFGAGFLKGWSTADTRPEFDIVTGMSTGALLATHAFLGTPADDAVLEAIFTDITADDIFRKEGLLGVIGGAPSLLNTAPLVALLEKYITAEVLERVAAEQDKGRRLLVGTTNLDYNRTWAWNLGLVAKQGGPEALKLYRRVLLASSAFPIMLPPVEI